MTTFYNTVCHEIVFVKPNGVVEFWRDDRRVSVLEFKSEVEAVDYAKSRGWREMLSR